MYVYRIGIVIMIAAVYAIVWGGFTDSNFLAIGSMIALVAGIILAMGGAGVAKYDENQRHRELIEALGKTDTEIKE